MSRVLDFGHVAINVRRWEQTKRFYGELLGLEFTKEVPTAKGYGLVYARLPRGGTLEFFRPDDLGSNPEAGPAPEASRAGTVRHFALAVNDVAAFRDALVAAGVPLVLDLTDLPDLGMRVIMVEDPNGIVVELTQAHA